MQDFGSGARWEQPPVKKRVADANTGSDDDTGNNRADSGEGTSGSSIRPPPSKCPCLPKQTPVPNEGSPAANNSARLRFLHSLSSHPSYKTLLGGVSTMPIIVCSLFTSSIWTCLIFYI